MYYNTPGLILGKQTQDHISLQAEVSTDRYADDYSIRVYQSYCWFIA